MKLKFNSDLSYQTEAVNSIVRLFEGQEIVESLFTVEKNHRKPGEIFDKKETIGIGNKLLLHKDAIFENLKNVQLMNAIPQSSELDGMNFTVEMETGTGKTYVYLKTIFELNKNYGFRKFIIVVPSIAIKEGVNKSIEITKEHFKELYDNKIFDYFVYDSNKLEQVRSFAVSSEIQIMIINIDAFKKSFSDPEKESKANIIHRFSDKMPDGVRAIDLISETNPIVIIDEPQSVDNTKKSKEAIAELNPLCTLRYSATHKEKYNLVYKLDSVDAYEKQLVKQIEVSSILTENNSNLPYIRLLEVDNRKDYKARIEFDISKDGSVKREAKWVKKGSDIYELSGGRDVYDGYIVDEIDFTPGSEYIYFTNSQSISLGNSIGEVDELEIKRIQIRKTIRKHLEKELYLRNKGIKVLSLFFIDKVSNYRLYNKDGNPEKGVYAKIFEEEYSNEIKKPKYRTLFDNVDVDTISEKVHEGYFSIDKKGIMVETKTGNSQDDENAYNLIMKDKERLLSFDTPLKFIFSHSALKEGWDNPNVFQICTLNQTKSDDKKRQQIGRGLRLCVNQDGERLHGFDINNLTVIANESFEQFATDLQKEIEEEEGIRFRVIEKHSFASIIFENEKGEKNYLGQQNSEKLWNDFLNKEYIDKKGNIKDKLKSDIKDNSVQIPQEFSHVKNEINHLLRKLNGNNFNIKNADDRKDIKYNKQIALSEDFKKLWDKIKYQTTYSVNFDSEKLKDEIIKQIKDNLVVPKPKFRTIDTKVKIDESGVDGTQEKNSESYEEITGINYQIPDIITYLQNETHLTRKTIVEIIVKSEKIDQLKRNPQKYIEEVLKIIKTKMRHSIVDGIKYQKLGSNYYYTQELFENTELYGYLSKNMIESQKSVYDHVLCDSTVESDFAEKLENSKEVKVYTKLPRWFKIDTP
ncbi:MAG: DEAD/DEAH box helicase family protein, partial [Candidatus Muirbacterium halophilum]|nr:DEAD/DEAH box helicase family protein [Candidatus Muirbacterium halophilum]